ncbi:MAG: alpha-1,2-fucosyltransferase [Spirochaetales bacterium]|nr:alpha-1,2-fucosyltransferase [Spirochaetales bacterium]
MIITHIKGGLGNQMFQYAMGRALSLRLKTNLKLDLSWYERNNNKSQYGLHIFSMDVDTAARKEIEAFAGNFRNPVLKKINRMINKYLPVPRKRFIIEKKDKAFDPAMLAINDQVLLEGYWQSEHYFKDAEMELRKDFSFSINPLKTQKEILHKIASMNSVCLHFRRGDYYQNIKTEKIFGTCGIDYYVQAVRFIASRIKDPFFFIFSNDLDWVKSNFKIDFPMHFMYPVSHDATFDDFYAMSHCKHFIIANSTFSWWGAWLSKNTKKIVIVPRRWNNRGDKANKDRHPNAWIQL